MAMQQRTLAGQQISSVGLGCMNFSHAYGPSVDAAQAQTVIHAALDAGVTMFDTAALYGFGVNEQLVGPMLKPHRQKIFLASKGGMAGVQGDDGVTRRVIDGHPATLRRNCEDSLRRLGTDVLDLYYLHRWDKRIPIEESVGAMSRLVEEGKVRALGLSEVSALTLRKAHATYPIAAVQSEYSLWTRNPEIAVLDACRDLGVSFVAFSPVGRGFLAGGVQSFEALGEKDIRRAMPRFHPDTLPHNLRLLAPAQALADALGASLAELAIAWVLSRGPQVVALPGTTQVNHLHELLAGQHRELKPEDLQTLEAIFDRSQVKGGRYAAQATGEVDSENFPEEAR